MKAIMSIGFAALAASLLAAPGGDQPGGGGGTQPGGNQPGGGSSATFTFDSFIAESATSNGLIVREGVLIGYASPTAAAAASAVTKIADGACANCATLTSIDLSATAITTVPDAAFARCTALAEVVLPSTCTAIGANAFAGCTKLATLTAPSVTAVGSDAFRDCPALAGLPDAVTAVGAFSFAGTGVAAVDLAGITAGEGVFAGCTALKSVANAPSELPGALFAGCTALAETDWTGVSIFGQASLAGIPATTLAIDANAEVSAYAFAASEATVATTLANGSVPAHDAAAFLGREVSYSPVAGISTRIEAAALVAWLMAEAENSATTVAQPASYSTADLEAWLAAQSNEGAVLAFAYASQYADDAAFRPLDIFGKCFLWTAPDAAATESITVILEGSYSIGDDADWSEANLVYDSAAASYVAASEDAASCFARLKFIKAW